MKKTTPLLTLLLLLPILLFAQESDKTLEEQFTNVFDKSNRYEDYKVIKIYKLNALRKNVLDSVSSLELEVQNIQSNFQQEQQKTSQLSAQLETSQSDLAESRQKEEGIAFFGGIIKKSNYKFMMWGIIGFLLFVLLVLFFRFRRSHAITREARSKLAETEEEFERHRQRTLEKEQQLRRKLQDEIMKNRKTAT